MAEAGGSGYAIWDAGAVPGGGDEPATGLPTFVRQSTGDPPVIRCAIASDAPLAGFDGPRIFTGFVDGTVVAWDEDGGRLGTFNPPLGVEWGGVWLLKACPDRLVSGHDKGLMCVYDVGTLGDGGDSTPVLPLAHMRQSHLIDRIEILECEDGSRRILAGDTTYSVMLWDMDTGALLKRVPWGWVSGCFLPLEQPDRAYHAVVAGWDGQVRVVDLGEKAPGLMVRSALKLG
jgi:WD40 repeat protein